MRFIVFIYFSGNNETRRVYPMPNKTLKKALSEVTPERRELLLGAGSKSEKVLAFPAQKHWTGLVRLDMNSDHKPDVVWDLDKKPWPFEDNSFDEVHAYELMEHLGRQGDYRGFFKDFSEIWRILKPDGYFFATSPDSSSRWAWGDPGHVRIISPECLIFLVQTEYEKQVGKTPMTDYRFCYRADFDVALTQVVGDPPSHRFSLKAVKPSRCVIT